jgi:hypothetical protein
MPIHKMGMAYHCNVSMVTSVTAAIQDGIDDETETMQRAAEEARVASGRQSRAKEAADKSTPLSAKYVYTYMRVYTLIHTYIIRQLAQKLQNIQAFKRLIKLFPTLKELIDLCAENKDPDCFDIIVKTVSCFRFYDDKIKPLDLAPMWRYRMLSE